jgi:hypothetical protein
LESGAIRFLALDVRQVRNVDIAGLKPMVMLTSYRFTIQRILAKHGFAPPYFARLRHDAKHDFVMTRSLFWAYTAAFVFG